MRDLVFVILMISVIFSSLLIHEGTHILQVIDHPDAEFKKLTFFEDDSAARTYFKWTGDEDFSQNLEASWEIQALFIQIVFVAVMIFIISRRYFDDYYKEKYK